MSAPIHSATIPTISLKDLKIAADVLRLLSIDSGESLVFVGDLMDRGPDPVGVVRRVRELGARAVMGNHDEKHVRFGRHEARRLGEPAYRNPLMMSEERTKEPTAVSNRRALHDYFILESYEAGITLKGTEVKSLRQGSANFQDAYGTIRNGEVWLIGMHISPFEMGNINNHEPKRDRNRRHKNDSQNHKVEVAFHHCGHAALPGCAPNLPATAHQAGSAADGPRQSPFE